MAVHSVTDRLMEPVGACLTPEVAERILALRADAELQARVDELADQANSGTLNPADREEYEEYLRFSQFVTLLQLKARGVLDHSSGAA